MNSRYGSLIILIKAYSFEEQEIEYKYKSDYLELLDKETYQYKDAMDFFAKKKKQIKENLNQNKKEYNLIFEITDIELIEIYIQKPEKKILPMFQNIEINNVAIPTEDLILNKMAKGNIIRLYELDKELTTEEYESIFKDFPSELLELLEIGTFLYPEDYRSILEILKTKRRYFQIVRFLLSKTEDLTLENFKKSIFLYEQRKVSEESNSRVRKEWLPYVD